MGRIVTRNSGVIAREFEHIEQMQFAFLQFPSSVNRSKEIQKIKNPPRQYASGVSSSRNRYRSSNRMGWRAKSFAINEAVIRIAGNSQDGIQAIGGFLARLAGRSEQEVMTFMTIPSTISGGPSIFQVRIGSGEVLSAGDEADVLLAFYQHSYEDHINSLKKGRHRALRFRPRAAESRNGKKDYHHVGVPISGLTVEAIGGTAKDKGKNIFALGLIAKMFDLNVPKLEKLIGERFTGKDPSILNNALAAFHAGYAIRSATAETFKFVDSQKKDGIRS
jgi:2-oxoglutarate/2-oxoacid ferredoxin oxidoreductase subunit alpha